MASRESDYSRPTVRRRGMRTGYTTGACAAAAAKAATLALLTGEPQRESTIRLPMGRDAAFTLKRCELTAADSGGNGGGRAIDGASSRVAAGASPAAAAIPHAGASPRAALCSVIKDGGDDPDVTSGAEICAKVWAGYDGVCAVESAAADAPSVAIRGGEGVGVVTKPGTGIPVGEASITRVPRRMIAQAVLDAAESVGSSASFIVEISVPDGREIAKRTDNPRLGIVNGISILGTTGVVQPFSTAAWRASVNVSIDVAAANRISHMVISAGTQSEEFAKRRLVLPDMAYVNVGIFTGAALKRCAQRGIPRATLVGMIGKFSKIAMGKFVTHVAGNKVDPAFLAGLAAECGASERVQADMRQAASGRHFQEIALEHGLQSVFDVVCARVCSQAQEYLADKADAIVIDAVCFDFEGGVLGKASTSAEPVPLVNAAASDG